MRVAIVSMCAVFAASLAVCLLSLSLQTRAISEIDALRDAAVRELDSGDAARLQTALNRLEEKFEHHAGVLELIASHSDLQEARACLADARISLQYGDGDDAGQALAQMGEALDHILDHEKLSLKNII